jgi:hypothetical protein
MGSTLVNTVKGGSTVSIKFEIFAVTEFTSIAFNANPIGHSLQSQLLNWYR